MDFNDFFKDKDFFEQDREDLGDKVDQMLGADLMFGMNSQEIEELRTQKDSVIFLLDCHRSMQKQNPHNGQDQQSNIEQVLRATLSFIKTKIVSNENDKIGIVLYGCGGKGGCEENKNSLNFKNIHVLYNLDIPDAGLIKALENKISSFTKDHGFFDDVGQPDQKESQSGQNRNE